MAQIPRSERPRRGRAAHLALSAPRPSRMSPFPRHRRSFRAFPARVTAHFGLSAPQAAAGRSLRRFPAKPRRALRAFRANPVTHTRLSAKWAVQYAESPPPAARIGRDERFRCGRAAGNHSSVSPGETDCPRGKRSLEEARYSLQISFPRGNHLPRGKPVARGEGARFPAALLPSETLINLPRYSSIVYNVIKVLYHITHR